MIRRIALSYAKIMDMVRLINKKDGPLMAFFIFTLVLSLTKNVYIIVEKILSPGNIYTMFSNLQK